jgi:type I restriction enzyme S subunit
MSSWPKIALGELLQRANEPATLNFDAEYQEVTIRLWGKGVISRGKVLGSEVGAARRFVRTNQLILSKIDARNGAIGLVPEELDGAIVSNDFPTFQFPDPEKCDPAFMGWLVRSTQFVDLCKASSEGTTNRVRIKEDRFLAQKVKLPPLAKQKYLVAHLDMLSDKARQVAEHLDAIDAHSEAIVLSLHHKLARDRMVRLGDLIEQFEDAILVLPDGEYPQVGMRGFGGGLFAKTAITGTETSYRAFNRLFNDALVLSQVKGWEGAVAFCPPKLVGMFVSPEYRTFRCKPSEAIPAYLSELIKTPWFWSLLQGATRGVGARRERTRPEQFLNIRLPMPKLDEQIRGVEILSRQADLRRQHAAIREFNSALVPATLERIFPAGDT